MDWERLDPHDDAAVARWAAQLGVPEARLRQAIAGIGTEVDKLKAWLAAHPAAQPADTGPAAPPPAPG